MRLVILNDLHAGELARNPRVASNKVWSALEKTLPYIQALDPDRVLLLGDLIQNKDTASDVELFRRVLEILSPLREKAIFSMGNHESRGLGMEMTQILLREQGFDDTLFGLQELGDANLLWLSTHQEGKHEDRSDYLPQEQLNWLSEKITQLKKPTLLFAHHGLLPQRLEGNFYFEHGHVDRMTIQNWKDFSSTLKSTEQIPLIVQGHAHWLSFNGMHSVPMLTLPSFVENMYWQGEDVVPAHYTLIETDETTVHVRVYSGEFVTATFEVPLFNS